MNIEALLKLSLIDPLEAQVLLAHALALRRPRMRRDGVASAERWSRRVRARGQL